MLRSSGWRRALFPTNSARRSDPLPTHLTLEGSASACTRIAGGSAPIYKRIMTTAQSNELDLTSQGVEFAPWSTAVENDELLLLSVDYSASNYVDFLSEGFRLTHPEISTQDISILIARFISKDKRAGVNFVFRNVCAFRMLDEHGLMELWEASAEKPRPAQSTFQVRGHAWQAESPLVWYMRPGSNYFSYMVATGWECLEVICSAEPSIKIVPATIHQLEKADAKT